MSDLTKKPKIILQKLTSKDELLELILQLTHRQELFFLVFSQNSKSSGEPDPQKIKIQPFLWKTKPAFQSTHYIGKKIAHFNYTPSQMEKVVSETISQTFVQVTIQTSNERFVAVRKKEGFLLSSNSLKLKPTTLEHNRKKENIFPEGSPSPVLHALGIMDEKGAVIPSTRNKFTQMNRFLEMLTIILVIAIITIIIIITMISIITIIMNHYNNM